MKKQAKILVVVIAFLLSVLCIASSAFAALTDRTETVSNTFVVGEIGLSLKESENLDLKLIVGTDIKKDPKLTVDANSVDSYVFVKLETSNNLELFVDYELADGWIPLGQGVDNVYYRTYDSNASDVTYSVLKDDKVTVKSYGSDDIEDVELKPTLSFTGYAIQRESIDDAKTAWDILNESM